MDGIDLIVGSVSLAVVIVWGESVWPRLRPRLDQWAKNRQRLYVAKELAKKANAEAWDASYRCYDLCEPPAYIRKAEGYRWLGRMEG